MFYEAASHISSGQKPLEERFEAAHPRHAVHPKAWARA